MSKIDDILGDAMFWGVCKGKAGLSPKQAKQAILEALKAEMPEEYEHYYDQSPMRKGHMMGYNEALREVAKALDEMFGVSDEPEN